MVLDLYSRGVVGWSMSEAIGRNLVLSALDMAIESRHPPRGLVHHSDRGSQYASEDYRGALAIFEYIEALYNRPRRYSTLGDVSPVQFELAALPRKLAA